MSPFSFSIPNREGPWPRRICVLLLFFVAIFTVFESPITFAFDPNEEQCLPDVHLALLVRSNPSAVARNDYVFFKPTGALSYVHQRYVLKQVTGVPGDRLVIKDGRITVNGALVASGMALLDPKKANPKDFERDEVIPSGVVFATGTAPMSNDSRYWGYLPTGFIDGKGYRVL